MRVAIKIIAAIIIVITIVTIIVDVIIITTTTANVETDAEEVADAQDAEQIAHTTHFLKVVCQ